jgi:hypothetical protein
MKKTAAAGLREGKSTCAGNEAGFRLLGKSDQFEEREP